MGLVISLANPQSANRLVIRINGTRYFFSTTAGFDVDVFLFIVFFVLRVAGCGLRVAGCELRVAGYELEL